MIHGSRSRSASPVVVVAAAAPEMEEIKETVKKLEYYPGETSMAG